MEVIGSALISFKILQIPVIFALIFVSWQIGKYENYKEFKHLAFAWILNLAHIGIYGLLDYMDGVALSKTETLTKFILSTLPILLDIIAGYIFLSTIRPSLTIKNWTYAGIVPDRKKILGFGFITAIIMSIASSYLSYKHLENNLNLLLVIPSSYVLFMTFDGLGNYFFEISGRTDGNLVYKRGMQFYALIQFLPLFFTNSLFSHISSIFLVFGYCGGLIAKTIFAFGLITFLRRLDQKFPSKEDPFVILLNEGFHEIKGPYRAIESTCEMIIENKKYFVSNSVRPLIDQIRVNNSLGYALANSYERILPDYKSINIYEEFERKVLNNLQKKDELRENNLNGVIQMCVFLVSRVHVDKKIKIVTEYSGASELECYIYDMYQIFRNILNNACEAFPKEILETSPDFRPSILVKTKKIRKNNRAYIRTIVKDNGIGFDSSKTEDVFRKGYSTKKISVDDKQRGHGLNIVKVRVDKYKGDVEVQSILNKKLESNRFMTKFTVDLPL